MAENIDIVYQNIKIASLLDVLKLFWFTDKIRKK